MDLLLAGWVGLLAWLCCYLFHQQPGYQYGRPSLDARFLGRRAVPLLLLSAWVMMICHAWVLFSGNRRPVRYLVASLPFILLPAIAVFLLSVASGYPPGWGEVLIRTVLCMLVLSAFAGGCSSLIRHFRSWLHRIFAMIGVLLVIAFAVDRLNHARLLKIVSSNSWALTSQPDAEHVPAIRLNGRKVQATPAGWIRENGGRRRVFVLEIPAPRLPADTVLLIDAGHHPLLKDARYVDSELEPRLLWWLVPPTAAEADFEAGRGVQLQITGSALVRVARQVVRFPQGGGEHSLPGGRYIFRWYPGEGRDAGEVVVDSLCWSPPALYFQQPLELPAFAFEVTSEGSRTVLQTREPGCGRSANVLFFRHEEYRHKMRRPLTTPPLELRRLHASAPGGQLPGDDKEADLAWKDRAGLRVLEVISRNWEAVQLDVVLAGER